MATRTKTQPQTCSMTITIKGTAYAVRPLTVNPESGATKCYRLRKATGEAYYVAETLNGPTCDCGDFTFRKNNTANVCKHVKALQAFGMIADHVAKPNKGR